MVKGERDFTLRAISTSSPGGLIGGRLVAMEDFESLITHDTGTAAQFSFTTTQGEVLEGDASGKFTMDAGDIASFNMYFPNPTPSILSASVIFRPENSYTGLTVLQLYYADGAQSHTAQITLKIKGGYLTLELSDSTGTSVTLRTYPTTSLANRPHVLYFSMNLALGTYLTVLFDGDRIDASTYAYARAALASSPAAYVAYLEQTAPTEAMNIFFDNLAVLVEEA